MNDDEQLLRGRVHGHDRDDPGLGPGPRPDRTHAELAGGPLDDLLPDTHGWRTGEADGGAVLITEAGCR